jgi:multidrug transporter EmrE-like cation transporter
MLDGLWVGILAKYGTGWAVVPASLIMLVEFALFNYVLRSISITTAYAVWVGLGSLSVVAAGLWLGDTLSAAKFACIVLIILATLGLKVL